eukprot:Gregarina_sp_Poly_1__9768@NODE_622_length_7094_cov_92_849580_g477_i0_p3_GENE_NODE_622_length_7094_cov_92_849580_g477_i0NODE_622_length_7094_cov_92_849580_g477_i0_p3_ORF_typecomplete_len362_score37_90Galactosyl_T/PF01762_21/1_4e42Fringe/PF02434_16/4_6e09_NODE_622_length_7094_cov_92_849580_g477_i023243409
MNLFLPFLAMSVTLGAPMQVRSDPWSRSRIRNNGKLRRTEHDAAPGSKLYWLDDPPNPDTYPFPNILVYPSQVCAPEVKVVAAVLTIPSADNWRAYLRKLHHELGGNTVKVIFPVGRSKNNIDGQHIDKLMLQEAAIHRDILLADYYDSYEELPQKTISAMAWFTKSCTNATFFVKVDDDVIINWGSLLKYLKNIEEQGFIRWDGQPTNSKSGEVWVGRRWDKSPVIKDPKHRNYEIYTEEFFPPYTSGPCYVINRKVARMIIHQRHRINQYFRNEDALIGILMKSTGIEPTDNRRFIVSSDDNARNYACLEETDSMLGCLCENWFSFHAGHSGAVLDTAIKAAQRCLREELDNNKLMAKR